MPEIKLKHVVSFSSEDKVHKAENLIQPETYRKWKCSTTGEKNATVVLQFEKASQIHSIDIGNESSAFVEVLVGRSSDNLNNFQVILVASSFMSPIESRNETHTNRVRMFGPEKLSQNVKDEKWDCVQIVCTQPFNKNISYGLSFIKFHSPPEKVTETPKNSEAESTTTKIGAFRLKTDDEEDSPPVGFLFGKQKTLSSDDKQKDKFSQKAPSYAASVLASSSITTKEFSKNTPSKRKSDDKSTESNEPPSKKSPGSGLNKDYIVYKNLDLNKNNEIASGMDNYSSKNATSNKRPATNKSAVATDKPSTSSKPEKVKKKVPFGKIMKNVVFVLSGFVNPMRSELRDKALEMGAKYKADWDKSSTHLVCAFINTPKYVQVRGQDGIVVTKEWILDCYKKKALLPWKDYKLGSYNISGSSAEESETPDEDELQVIMNSKTNGTKSPKNKSPSKQNTPVNSSAKKQPARIAFLNEQSNSKDGSETEDEDALEDYMADTDVESNSGGDTEDEIRKVENKAKRKAHASPAKNSRAIKEASPLAQKPNVDDLPLPELPNLFKGRHFFLFGDFTSSKHHELHRYITAYNGVIEDYMSDTVKYVISEAKWDKNFEDALSENEDLIFAKPLWIYKCHESGKLVPYQPYIIIPDS